MPTKDKVKSVVFQSLIKNKLKGKSVLISVSGGLDSIALLSVLNYFKDKFKLKLSVIYLHHGKSKDKAQMKFRNDAQKLVKTLCQKMKIEFVTLKSEQTLESEHEFREFRYDKLNSITIEKNIDLIALGHHRDDLLESRVIRLIRGVGAQGLESMSEVSGKIYRPFLALSRMEIEQYVRAGKLKFINDPSNKNNKYLRNWIRNKWFKDLESYHKGALKSLSHSLENLVPKEQPIKLAGLVTEEGISRSGLIGLTKGEQRQLFAYYLRTNNVKNYTSSQIDEILKRLDSSKKELKFHVMGLDWTVDTRHIRCRTS